MAVIASIVLGAELRWRGPKAPVTGSSTTPNQYQSKENLNIPLAPMPGGRSHITRLLTYYSILTHPYLDGSRDSRASAVRLTRAAELLTDEKRPQRWQKLLGPFLLLTVSDVWRGLPAAWSCASDRSASAVHDAMASIATRAARRATSKSSMSGARRGCRARGHDRRQAVRNIRAELAEGCTPASGEGDLNRQPWRARLPK
jgi:hypothetical protein